MLAKTKNTLPPWISSELRFGERLDEMIVVLSQKKSFAFYKTEFHSTVLHLADQKDTYFTLGAAETSGAIVAIAAELAVARVLFIGCSKGGFGALLMAALCSTKDRHRRYSSLCFGPQTRIFPENPRVRFPSYKKLLEVASADRSIAEDLARYGDVTHVPSTTSATIIFGNLNANDRSEAESVSGESVSLVRLPLQTHSVVLPFLVDNTDKAAVSDVVDSLTRAAGKQADLQSSMRSNAIVDEILMLPRTKSLAALCQEAISGASGLRVFNQEAQGLDTPGGKGSSTCADTSRTARVDIGKGRAMKKALWVTCGVRGNAGDALLYQVTRKLFDGLVDLDFRFVHEPVYIRDGQDAPDNVIIGPGGMFVQTNSSRHLHQKIAKQWDQFQNSKFFLWSTGILAKPTDEELNAVRRVTARAPKIIVRATREADFIRGVDPSTEPEWSPCVSLFTDTLLDIKPRKRDLVVVNLDEFLFNEANFQDHPLRRFKAYAEAEGLEVRSMINAAGDSNRMLLELFPPIEIDMPYFGDLLQAELTGKEFNYEFNEALSKHPSFGERYCDSRFAFGKRLHGWLPFLAFDTPAAFIGMPERRGMPVDYFGSNEFLCNVPRNPKMTRGQLDDMANAMIGKLNFFIHNEDRLVASIAEKRAVLGDKLRAQAAEFAATLT